MIRSTLAQAMLLLLLLLLFLLPDPIQAGEVRQVTDFDGGWLFKLGDFSSAMMAGFDDSDWQPVVLPHDWSSDGPFSASLASGTGYAPGGIGWYRKHFLLDQGMAGKSVSIEFDGVYEGAEVWVNGQFVGARPFGYSSFQCDLTPYLNFGEGGNVVSVRVDHSRFADSRYYTGSGIYRNVRLVVANQLHVAHWGVCITTPQVGVEAASVRVETRVENNYPTVQFFALETKILAPDGSCVATARGGGKASPPNGLNSHPSSCDSVQQLTVLHPQMWDVQDPQLYRAVSRITVGGKCVDEVTTVFGIREAHFDPERGFFLNGKSMKIKGVCLHHDAGAIGAAVPDKVLERRLLALKEIGVNAIRTSHNPPDPGLLDLCDRLGFLVMDEAFDEWTPGKNKWVTGVNRGQPSHFGYGEEFAQWAVTDISDMVRRDRNHPSIILWSIGNEIDFANDPFSDPVLGAEYRPHNPSAKNLVLLARPLIAAVKALDATRPVTAALATVSMSDAVGLAGMLDADGYNYQEWRYAMDHRNYPGRIIFGSETSHQYSAWLAVRDNEYISGQFLWTGADYLGEANEWPNRASGPGLLDLCGFKKPSGWFRQSLWSDKPMVYICGMTGRSKRRGWGGVESWNWPSNSDVAILCFANTPEVTLTLNGRTVGDKKLSEAVQGILHWEIPYEPGKIEATGRDMSGKALCDYALQTSGPPARIQLLPDATQLRPDGKDICNLEYRIVDAQGVRVPDATPEVTFALTGPVRLLGLGNADLNDVENEKANRHRAFQGRGLAILQTTGDSGQITIQASSPGLVAGKVTLQSHD